MSNTAIVIAIAYLVVIVIGAVLAVVLRSSTFLRGPFDERAAERREKSWLLVVILGLVALLFATIFFAPYGKSAPKNAQPVHVLGEQFAWIIEPQRVKANVPVVFYVRSKDVAHGFGVYGPKDVLLVQVQVPTGGKTQQLIYTFKTPGTYKVLCLEYCGLDHHLMESRFEVTP